MQTFLSLAINQVFPEIDDTFRQEIEQNALLYVLQITAHEYFQISGEDRGEFESKVNAIGDKQEQANQFLKLLNQKVALLSQEEQDRISAIVDQKLTEFMHKLYLEYSKEE